MVRWGGVYKLVMLLRRMVATFVMYGVHAVVSAVVASKAHYMRYVLKGPSDATNYIAV